MLGFVVALLSAAAAVEPVVLDNGAIRIEVDPALFTIRYIGLPGGTNFIEPLHVSREPRAGQEWVDPGGITTDLPPFENRDAALQRGPAEVVEQSPERVAMIGPVSPELNMRLKKEIRIDPRRAAARYRVTLLAEPGTTRTLAMRNTVRIPRGVALSLEPADGTIRPLAGTPSIEPFIQKQGLGWEIAVPSTEPAQGIILGATTPTVAIKRDGVAWTRRLRSAPETEKEVPLGAICVVLLDDPSNSYGVMLQTASVLVNDAMPLVMEEEWALHRRGAP